LKDQNFVTNYPEGEGTHYTVSVRSLKGRLTEL